MSTTGELRKPRKSKKLLIASFTFFAVIALGILAYSLFYNHTYNSLSITVDTEKTIEYGSSDYKIKDFILGSNGKVKILNDVDSSIIGKQEVAVKVEKYNISRILNFDVNVVDTVAPVIELKDTDITITEGEDYNFLDNISSVTDSVDGEMTYQMSSIVNNEVDTNYYTINTDFDKDNAGTYTLEVKAVDKGNNVTTQTFTINVEKPVIVYRAQVTANAGVNHSGNAIVDTAYSLVGSPYVGGGNSPAGFDCSGFVQYVYGQNGIYVSRSTYTQAYDGVGVSYADAQPGDILLWGYSNGTITHSALYIGNDTMIHAANPSTGVIVSSVSGWTRGSDVQVLQVRRIAS